MAIKTFKPYTPARRNMTVSGFDGVDLGNLDTEDSFNSFLDLGLVGVNIDHEDVLLVSNVSHGLLGDDRSSDDIINVLHYANTSTILARAA